MLRLQSLVLLCSKVMRSFRTSPLHHCYINTHLVVVVTYLAGSVLCKPTLFSTHLTSCFKRYNERAGSTWLSSNFCKTRKHHGKSGEECVALIPFPSRRNVKSWFVSQYRREDGWMDDVQETQQPPHLTKDLRSVRPTDPTYD